MAQHLFLDNSSKVAIVCNFSSKPRIFGKNFQASHFSKYSFSLETKGPASLKSKPKDENRMEVRFQSPKYLKIFQVTVFKDFDGGLLLKLTKLFPRMTFFIVQSLKVCKDRILYRLPPI